MDVARMSSLSTFAAVLVLGYLIIGYGIQYVHHSMSRKGT